MSELKINQSYEGFTLCEIKRAEEIESTLYRFSHAKTGAQLIFSDRADENKAFAVTFKTTPFDDTGVFHILEHSVFCGSDKYPVKDPFIRMLQTSMQTFLNAMTYPDKTVYPVSSRNSKDFKNLMDVYLDAVFHPAFLKNPNVFYQEGWHYEVDEDSVPFPQGIVYSEMQGVFSELDGEIESAVSNALFGGTPYEYVYGGHPDAIPTLTYEKFCETYHKYYSPSNALIILDGSIELCPVLSYLDGVLNCADNSKRAEIVIPKKGAHARAKVRRHYGVSQGDCDNKDVLILTKTVGSFDTKKKNTGANILCSYLCESNESPLKRALLDTGLCEDVKLYMQEDFIEPALVLEIRGSKEEHFEALKSTVFSTVQKISAEGLEKSQLEGTLADFSFAEQERSANFGLSVISRILQSYLYGGDMAQNLSFTDTLADLKKEIDTDYYEKLLLDIFKEEDFSQIHLIAKPDLLFEKQEKLYEKMTALRDSLGDEKIAQLREKAENLLRWQEAEDSKEALETLPVLSLSDIERDFPVITPEVSKGDFDLITIPCENPNITYIRMYFALPKSVENRLFQLSILTNLLTNLPTANYSAKELQNRISRSIGNISFDIFGVDKTEKTCKAYLAVELSALNENVGEALKLTREILLNTRFDGCEKTEELLLQIRSILKDSLSANGHKYAALRALSGLSAAAALKEIAGGYTAIQSLDTLLDNFKDNHASLSADFTEIITAVIGKNGFTAALCGKAPNDALLEFARSLPNNETASGELSLHIDRQKCEGIAVHSDISFAGLGGHLRGEADAAAFLAAHLLSYEYLWNEIRVQNGAYGAGMQVKENGEMMFYSYRDPSAENSLNVYKNAHLWLSEVADSAPDLDSVKIGTINELDPLLTASQKLSVAANGYFTGLGAEYKAKIRRALLNVTPDDLKEFAKTLAEQTENGEICVVGSKETLQNANLTVI